GIRDKLVTGVQTCALPISKLLANGSPLVFPLERGPQILDGTDGGETRVVFHWQAASPERNGEVMPVVTETLVQLIAKQVDDKGRSEERRVGKECREGGTR